MTKASLETMLQHKSTHSVKEGGLLDYPHETEQGGLCIQLEKEGQDQTHIQSLVHQSAQEGLFSGQCVSC